MKKLLMLILMAIVLTGCSVDYNLVINEGVFEETISIIENDSSKFYSPIDSYGSISYKERIDWLNTHPIYVFKNSDIDPYDDTIEVSGVKYYNKEKVVDDNKYGVVMTTSGDIENINDLRSLSHCYEVAQVINNKDEYVLSTSFKNYCFENYTLLTEMTINLTTDMKVTSNNADSISGNTYTWKITKDNYENKSISLAMQSIRDYKNDKYYEEEAKKQAEEKKRIQSQKKSMTKIFGIFGISFVVVIAIILIAIFIKNRKENNL